MISFSNKTPVSIQTPRGFLPYSLEKSILFNLKSEFDVFKGGYTFSKIIRWFKQNGIENAQMFKDFPHKGMLFIGQNNEEFFTGPGMIIYPSSVRFSECYIGFFNNGERHGRGCRLLRNKIFVGEYKNNLKDGEAVIIKTSDQKILFAGFFKKGQMEGACMFKDDFHYFQGEMANSLYHGHCSIMYANGDVFVGNMEKGKIQGQGQILFKNGDSYSGMFVNNQMQGKGVYSWNGFHKYSGIFHLSKIKLERQVSKSSRIDVLVDISDGYLMTQ